MRRYLREHTNPPVFIFSGVVILLFILAGVIFTDQTATVANAAQNFIVTYFGWLYIIGVSFFLIFAIGLLFTRYGNVRLGPYSGLAPSTGFWPGSRCSTRRAWASGWSTSRSPSR